jgi:two-component system LytT family response regulator
LAAGAAHSSLRTAWRPSARAERPGRPQLLVGKRERRLYLLDPDKVDYIESYGNHVRIWAGPEAYISRDSVKELAVRLAPAGFVRIERSRLVNVRAIAYIERLGRGRYSFTLTNGTCIKSTPTYRAEILRQVLPADFSRRQGTHD